VQEFDVYGCAVCPGGCGSPTAEGDITTRLVMIFIWPFLAIYKNTPNRHEIIAICLQHYRVTALQC